MKKMSENFRSAEFFGGKDMDGIQERIQKKLVEPILQPIRSALGIRIRITSGYRCPAKNAAVGGQPTSHHLCEADRCACDITCSRMADVWDWLKEHPQEFCYAYWDRKRNFIHISGLTVTDRGIGKTWEIEIEE